MNSTAGGFRTGIATIGPNAGVGSPRQLIISGPTGTGQ